MSQRCHSNSSATTPRKHLPPERVTARRNATPIMSTSSRSSIESWILSVESATASGRRKRLRQPYLPAVASRAAKKRRPLRVLSTNPAMSSTTPSGSPKKSRGRGRALRHADGYSSDQAAADVDATPRAGRARVGTTPSLPAPSSSGRVSSPDRTSTSRASTRKSARSASPVKGLADLTSSAGFVHVALDDILEGWGIGAGQTCVRLVLPIGCSWSWCIYHTPSR